MKKVVVMVLSFDKYSDLWPVYFDCAKKFWHVDIPTYLVTNEKKPKFENIEVITTGPEISWSRRARGAVNAIDAEYILLMLEDYYVTSEVTDQDICPLISFIERYDVDYLRIYPFPKMCFKDAGEQGIHKVPEKSLYGVNLQASIWKKEYLLRLLDGGDFSAWEFEARQKNGVATQIQGKLYTVDYAPFEMVNGVLQGKWYAPSVKTLQAHGIYVDTSNRAVLSWKKVAVYKSKIILRRIVGPNLIRKAKPILKKMGIKFVTE